MRRSRVPKAEKIALESKTKPNSSQRKLTKHNAVGPKSNKEDFFSEHGEHKKRKGKQDERKR